MLECPLYNPITNKLLSLFEDVIPGNLKSFFQLDQQLGIGECPRSHSWFLDFFGASIINFLINLWLIIIYFII